MGRGQVIALRNQGKHGVRPIVRGDDRSKKTELCRAPGEHVANGKRDNRLAAMRLGTGNVNILRHELQMPFVDEASGDRKWPRPDNESSQLC